MGLRIRRVGPGFQHALYSCCTLPLAALCALIMYGNLKKTEA